MKRTPLKRSTKPLKRSRLKRGKPYKRTAEQIAYHEAHPICEIEGCEKEAMPTPHHIDKRLLRADLERNLFSLDWNHHIGNEGVDNIGKKRFIEKFGLQDHPKWKEVYERVKNK